MADFIIKLLMDRAQSAAQAQRELVDLAKIELKAEQLAVRKEAMARRAADQQARAAKQAADAVEREARRGEAAAAKAANAAAREAARASAAVAREAAKQAREADALGAKQARAAVQAANVAAREARRVAAEAKKAADDQVREANRVAAQQARAAQQAARAQQAAVNAAWRDQLRVDAQRDRAVAAQARAAQRNLAAQRKAAEDSAGGFGVLGAAVTSVLGVVGGITAGVSLLKQLGEAALEAAEKQRQLARAFMDQRDAQREIAAMQDKPATTAFTLAQARQRTQTGMTEPQQRQFQTLFQAGGMQWKGTKLGEQEYEEFQLLTAKQAVALGIDPAVYGEYAGRMAGAKNWQKQYGKDAGKEAARQTFASFKMVQQGTGQNTTLTASVAKALPMYMATDPTAGIFQSPMEVGMAISAAAEITPENPDVLLGNVIKGIRGFGPKDKQAPLLKAAGITPETPFFEAISKLKAQVEKETKAGPAGTKTLDTLRKYFSGKKMAEAYAGYIGRGEQVFPARLKSAAELARPGVMEGQLEAAYQDPTSAIPERLAAAELESQKLQTGARLAEVMTLRTQAAAKVEERDRGGTFGPMGAWFRRGLVNMMRPGGQAGFQSSEYERQIEEQMFATLRERALAKGIKGEQFDAKFGPVGRAIKTGGLGSLADETFRGMTQMLGMAGVNPLAGGPGATVPEANPLASIPALVVLGEIRDLLKARPAPPAAPPGPVLDAPPQVAPANRPVAGAAQF